MPYNTAEIFQKDEPLPDGRVRLVVNFEGVGLPDIKREIYIDENTTLASLRAWAWNIKLALDGRKTIADQLVVGQSINLAEPNVPAPTAREVWLAKARRLLIVRELALTDATAVADRNALEADVNATYNSNFVNSL
jgi:hypothetical protein